VANAQGDPSPDTAETGFAHAVDLRAALGGGETASVALVETLLRRIGEIDVAGPALSSVISLDPAALELAQQLDEERRRGQVRGPLHGIPVMVKDNLDTAGGLATTAGSLALAAHDCQPASDSPVVALLRRSGAIVLGKANLSEWANFRARRSSSGWSALGGQCRNPHVLDRSPGGSSSGSGACVAAGLVPLAVGTETDGSILCPASLCGVVGVKPTVGLVSRTGIVPVAASQDTAGPLARCVADAALLLSVMSLAVDGDTDPATAARPAAAQADYLSLLSPDALRGARIGVARGRYFGYSRFADELAESAIGVMRQAGAVVVDPVAIETADEIADSRDEFVVLTHEFKSGLAAYLAARPGERDACPRTLAELIAFNEAHADRELAVFGQDLFIAAEATAGVEDEDYLAARDRNRKRAREGGIDATLAAHGLAAIAVPTMGPAWLIDHLNGDSPPGSGFQIAAVAGYPAVSVPIGKAHGLPLGLSLVGTAWSEATLLGLAYSLERALQTTMRPGFLRGVPLGSVARRGGAGAVRT
jgi:amidase